MMVHTFTLKKKKKKSWQASSIAQLQELTLLSPWTGADSCAFILLQSKQAGYEPHAVDLFCTTQPLLQ